MELALHMSKSEHMPVYSVFTLELIAFTFPCVQLVKGLPFKSCCVPSPITSEVLLHMKGSCVECLHAPAHSIETLS